MKRAPVQRSSRHDKYKKPAGTISWGEHYEAWKAYNKKYPGQSAECIAKRGGFGYDELVRFLGREPTTWEAVGKWERWME